ncbi:collagen alpha-1(X) chain-like [Astyanax mexicanus]|uniref:collagen alpha-1(X) chain-like n=1 Tax=Astyanax mexicanus TaxID=7994 RepID=UPI0020CB5089|nr:collagen alpha-1(X) chain-like [Astyanax mexicanus]
MKRTVTVTFLLLLLLLQISLQQTRAAADPKSLKRSDDLKNVLYEQGTALAEMKTQVKFIEKENGDLKTKMTRQIKRSRQTESQLESLKKEMAAQLSEVSVIRSSLVNVEAEMGKLKKENEDLKKKASTAEGYLKTLKKEITEKLQVAFSAGLSASVGPLSGLGVVVYTKVLTNTGGAYSPSTGVFTAPTAGIYYFRFTACGSANGQYSGVSLYRNQERLTHLSEYNNDGYPRHFSGGIAIHLSEGDAVTVRLPSSYRLYEDSYTRNIFSGFLLFPMDS